MTKPVRNVQYAWIILRASSGFGSCPAGTFITTRAYASGLKSMCTARCAGSIAFKTSPQALEKALRLKECTSNKFEIVISEQ
jgi:hypothetical protein